VRTAEDVPISRWPHDAGSFTTLYYKWGDNLQVPRSLWRNAFTAALNDWSIVPTKMYFEYSPNGSIVINTYNMQDGNRGHADIISDLNTGYTIGGNVFGNVFYDPGNNNMRHATAGHETGHSQSIGHIGDSEIALLGYNPDPSIYFIPQPIDIALVNQIYR
jgi:hypothetical protein